MRSADRINGLRHTALIMLRIITMTVLFIGAVHVFYAFGQVVVQRDINALFVWYDNGWNPFAWGFGIVAPAALVMLLDRRIVRWFIPVPRHECPQCGYGLRDLSGRRCPECGLQLSDSRDESSLDPQ